MNRLLLDKIAGARIVERAERFRDGKYLLCVKKILAEQKLKGTFFIGEFYVVEAQRVLENVEPNAIGSAVGFAINLETNLSGPGNAKAFILGLLGFDGEPKGEELSAAIEQLTSTAQPARGMLVAAETYRTTTKSNGVFVGLNWRYVRQDAEEVSKRRAQLDSNKPILAETPAAAA
jgi:hypothetical protein